MPPTDRPEAHSKERRAIASPGSSTPTSTPRLHPREIPAVGIGGGGADILGTPGTAQSPNLALKRKECQERLRTPVRVRSSPQPPSGPSPPKPPDRICSTAGPTRP